MKKPKTDSQTKKPKTDLEWALYRCSFDCRLGKNALLEISELPKGQKKTDYAIYCLLSAFENLAEAIALIESSRTPRQPRR
jgi:hypothetical protein